MFYNFVSYIFLKFFSRPFFLIRHFNTTIFLICLCWKAIYVLHYPWWNVRSIKRLIAKASWHGRCKRLSEQENGIRERKMSVFPSQESRPLKKPRLGPPDVYPQDSKQKEVNESTIDGFLGNAVSYRAKHSYENNKLAKPRWPQRHRILSFFAFLD